MAFGCFTDSNAVLISPKRGGLLFAANGGTDDVSVIDVGKALARDPGAEIARIPVAVGPWGMALSPDGSLVAVAGLAFQMASDRNQPLEEVRHRLADRR